MDNAFETAVSPAVDSLRRRMRVPMFGAPMFLVSSPALVAAQCKAGIVGVMPCLNMRPATALDAALSTIREELQQWNRAHPETPAAPMGVNLMVHASNSRLEEDLAIICEHRVDVVVTSLQPPDKVVQRIKDYGGILFHDVSQVRHARRAASAGVDGLVLVCAGAGGHTGRLSPFAFVEEVRGFFSGAVAVAGAVRHGRQIVAIEALGADFAYCGSPFIASFEASAAELYKQMVVDSAADDIVLSTAVTGLQGSYLRKSFERLGLDVEALQHRQTSSFDLALTPEGDKAKAWKDVWAAGQGVGGSTRIEPAMDIVYRFQREYEEARARAGA